jgi:hypothetical protein
MCGVRAEGFFRVPSFVQVIESSGWYSRVDLNWQSLVDFVVMAAMSSLGSTPQPVTPRLLRHMHVVGVTDQDDVALVRIFTVILQTHMKRGNFSAEASGLARPVGGMGFLCPLLGPSWCSSYPVAFMGRSDADARYPVPSRCTSWSWRRCNCTTGA